MNEYSLERLFHANTKNRNLTQWFDQPAPDSWTTIEYKTYERAPQIPLESTAETIDDSLGSVLTSRASPNAFTDESLTKTQFHGLLFGALETHTSKDGEQSYRAYPSAGARYPLEVYASVANVDGITPGLYHLNVADELLERLHETPVNDELATQSGMKMPESAAVTILLTAVPDRSRRKYGIRGYRYLLFEAGHLMQNLLLTAQALGFAGVPWGAFLERELDSYLNITATDEETIYVGLFGSL